MENNQVNIEQHKQLIENYRRKVSNEAYRSNDARERYVNFLVESFNNRDPNSNEHVIHVTGVSYISDLKDAMTIFNNIIEQYNYKIYKYTMFPYNCKYDDPIIIITKKDEKISIGTKLFYYFSGYYDFDDNKL